MPPTVFRSPRTALLALALLGVALLALSPKPAAAATEARAADEFVDSIGVNTHTYYTNTVYYQQFDQVKSRLAELGIRHIREELMLDRSDQYQRLRELAASGVGSTLVLGEPTIGISGLDQLLEIAAGDLDGAIEAIEGTNEYDLRGGSQWDEELRAHQEHLYSEAKANPALSSLPVIGPSVVHWSKQDELGDISAALDYGNIHSYPDGYWPETNLGSHLSHATTLSASKPVVATETGYHSALNWTGGHKPAEEAAVATYLPRMFLEYFRRGVARTFSYQLLDHWPNAELDERELQFGLLRNDLSPKPSFLALRNLIEILEDPGAPASPAALGYELSGDQNDLRQVLLQKRDGRFYLALWRASSVWDPVSRTRLNPPSSQVQVSVDAPLAEMAVYAPNQSATPISAQQNPGSSVTVNVGPQVLILELSPGSGGAEPEPTPEPEPDPEPAPEPEPEPDPEPAPEPEPEGDSTEEATETSPRKGRGRSELPKTERRRSKHRR